METFSSAKDRPRDKILQEKHQKELAEKDQKIERLQRANNESWKRHFEAQTRGNQLAQLLGFHDIFEALVAIDIAGHDITFKECFERVETLQEQFAKTRAENEALQERIDTLDAESVKSKAYELDAALTENKALSERVSNLETDQTRRVSENKQSRSTISRLEAELGQLQKRYDSLLDVKERAAERYKADYAKWRNVKQWFLDEEKEILKNEGVSEEEEKKLYKQRLMERKKLMMEIAGGEEPSSTPYSRPPPFGGITNILEDKENQITPARPTPALSSHSAAAHRIAPLKNKLLDAISHSKPPSSSPNLFNEGSLDRPRPQTPEEPFSRNQDPSPSHSDEPPRTSPTVVGTVTKPLRNRLLDSVTHSKEPLSSPAALNSPSSSRRPLNFEPVKPHSSLQVKQDIGSSPLAKHGNIPSSDTEEDSQAAEGPTLLPTSPAPMLSSETEADSQSQIFPFPFLDPTPCPVRPTKPMLAPATVHPSLPPKPNFPRGRRVISSRDSETLQPFKARRVSDENDADNTTPGPTNDKFRKGIVGKGKEREIEAVAPMSTPANPPPSANMKRIEDYSAYKGRGRYGNGVSRPNDTTINAEFEINPAQNGGLDFQYDEVVRNKDERRRMDAGDCECCRDYYEAVGPMPKRLQAPLWKSPPSTPAKPCPHHAHRSGSASKAAASTSANSNSGNRKRRQSEIASHKKAISRHRHQWDRPKTPPGYWNIGFPSTQETEEINARAREMHRQKRDEVDAAARREDGRYRRRS